MLKLNIGWSRKTGEANFGSRGASVHLELEVETGVVSQPAELQKRIHGLFRLARAAVDEELDEAGQASAPAAHKSNGRSATENQVRAIHAIARRRQLDLSSELRKRFNVHRPDELSLAQASELIDAMQPDDVARSRQP